MSIFLLNTQNLAQPVVIEYANRQEIGSNAEGVPVLQGRNSLVARFRQLTPAQAQALLGVYRASNPLVYVSYDDPLTGARRTFRANMYSPEMIQGPGGRYQEIVLRFGGLVAVPNSVSDVPGAGATVVHLAPAVRARLDASLMASLDGAVSLLVPTLLPGQGPRPQSPALAAVALLALPLPGGDVHRTLALGLAAGARLAVTGVLATGVPPVPGLPATAAFGQAHLYVAPVLRVDREYGLARLRWRIAQPGDAEAIAVPLNAALALVAGSGTDIAVTSEALPAAAALLAPHVYRAPVLAVSDSAGRAQLDWS